MVFSPFTQSPAGNFAKFVESWWTGEVCAVVPSRGLADAGQQAAAIVDVNIRYLPRTYNYLLHKLHHARQPISQLTFTLAPTSAGFTFPDTWATA